MKIRTSIIAIIVVLAFACAAFAQQDAAKRQRPAQQQGPVARLAKELGLSKDQTTKISEVVKKYHADVRTVMQSGATNDEKKSKVAALKGTAAQSIMAILSADQQKKASELNLIDKLLQPRTGEPQMNLERLLASLNLSEQQKTAIKAIMQDSAQKSKAVKADTTLTPDAKRAKLAAIREDTMSRVKAQLTAEQLKKLEETMKNRPGKGQRPNGTAPK